MAIWLNILIGSVLGLAGGAALGYISRCSGGTCPLTCTPWRSGLLGLFLGAAFVLMIGCDDTKKAGGTNAATEAGESVIVDVATRQAFNKQVLEADKPVLVEFHAAWCGYCKALAPTIEKLAAEYADRVAFVAVDVDDAKEIAREYDVSGIPLVLVFAGGEITSRIEGAKDAAAYRAALDKATAG